MNEFRIHTCTLILTATVYLFAVSPRAEAATKGEHKPILLMLEMENEEIQSLQTRFQKELALELVTHTLLVKPAFQFSSDNMSLRIEEIRKIASTDNAEAVIWLEKTKVDTISLQLVAPAPGQSMMRSMEAKQGRDTAGELVIAARALLKDIHITLKERDPAERSGVAVKPIEAEASGEKAAPPNNDRAAIMRLAAGLDTSGGFQGNTASPVLMGGIVTIGIGRIRGGHADLSLAVFSAPFPQIANGTFQTIGIRPGLGLGYLWGKQVVSLGPYLGLQVPWQKVSISVDGNRVSTDSWWNFRVVPSLDLRFQFHRSVLLCLRPGLGIHVKQEAFERASNGAAVYSSPYLDWNLVLGVVVHFN